MNMAENFPASFGWHLDLSASAIKIHCSCACNTNLQHAPAKTTGQKSQILAEG